MNGRGPIGSIEEPCLAKESAASLPLMFVWLGTQEIVTLLLEEQR